MVTQGDVLVKMPFAEVPLVKFHRFLQLVKICLKAAGHTVPHFQDFAQLEARLMRFEPIDSDLVPEDSMLREFIGQKQPVEGETGKVS